MINNKNKLAQISLKPIKSKHESGFTLIEVMVALAILAVVAVAASRASSAYLSSVDILRTRTLAHFVAQNAALGYCAGRINRQHSNFVAILT